MTRRSSNPPLFLATGGLLAMLACLPSSLLASESLIARQVDVAEAVGIVRHFHPHDAAVSVDWAGVLHRGFELAERSTSDAAFAEELEFLLAPLGHGIAREELDRSRAGPPLRCEDEQRPVRWAHQGLAAPPARAASSAYESRRIGLVVPETHQYDHAVFTKFIDVDPWRGQQLVFSGRVRVPEGGEAVLWIRVSGADEEILFFDNMDDRRISSPDWTAKGLVVPIPENAVYLAYGTIVYGTVPAQFDRLQLRVFDEGAERPVGDSLIEDPIDWRTTSDSQRHVQSARLTEDGVALEVTVPPYEVVVPERILTALDDAPQAHRIELVDGSMLRVPLALCPEQVGMDRRDRELLWRRYPALEVGRLSDSEQARLDVATLWAAMQHFYPYRAQLDAWPQRLGWALERANTIESRQGHHELLEQLLAHIQDGHVRVYEADPNRESEMAFLPLAIETIDGNLLVSVSEHPEQVVPGDRITSVDGEAIEPWMDRTMARHSGSKQWKRFRSIQDLLMGAVGERRSLGLERNGESLEVTLNFAAPQPLPSLDYPPIRELDNGIVHVYLGARGLQDLAADWPRLFDARGVIIDQRGYPRGFDAHLFGHFLEEDDQRDDWFQILMPRAPDGDLVVARESGWRVPALAPRITAPVVFLTNEKALSYAESIVDFARYHSIGPIIGSNTAGANGDVIPLMLPGGFMTQYSGLRVVGPSGNPYHGEGIAPDIVVLPSRDDLRNGRDAVLERAVEQLETMQSGSG